MDANCSHNYKIESRSFLATATLSGNTIATMLVYDKARLIALREERGWSRSELARRAGLKQPSLWAIEHGRTKEMKLSTAGKIARALGVPIAALVARSALGGDADTTEQLVAAWDALDEGGKGVLLNVAQTLIKQQKK